MIGRTLTPLLQRAAQLMPVVAVTGPRQSGKTTLCRNTFPDHAYMSLEPLDHRDFARTDPRGFLAQFTGPVILDEAQRAPDLFSYLQESVDEDPTPGRFIVTGSEHFGLSQAVSQSLAGRVRLLHLLPLSREELHGAGHDRHDLLTTLWMGGYPRIHAQALPAGDWLADYVATYVQRDVRQLLAITNLASFTTFLRLTAGRVAQELNLASLGADAGISAPTVRAWLTLLETSFVTFALPPWLANVRKRLVKAPKLHFVDTGLACHLLGIRRPEHLANHPLRGALFESWVASEILKWRTHRGLQPGLFHLREVRGSEIDLLIEGADTQIAVEVKSAQTIATDFLTSLRGYGEETAGAQRVLPRLVYGGDRRVTRQGVAVLPWLGVHDEVWD